MPAWLTRIRRRLRALLARQHGRELRDELQLHIDLLTDDYTAQGMPLHEARARAHREFGNLTRIQEISHDLFAIRALEELTKDLSCTLREARRTPWTTAVAVLSLAGGIGLATAAFSVVDALMLRGLPVVQPDRLVAFSNANGATWSRWSYAAFRQWVEARDAPFTAAAVYDPPLVDQPLVSGRPVRVSVVSGNFFGVLGVPAAAGRVLVAADDGAGAEGAVAVISYAFMERQFAHVSAAIGSTLAVHGTLYEIVGVARRGFAGEWVGQPTDIWLALGAHAHAPGAPFAGLRATSPARAVRVLARLNDHVTVEQATAAANLIWHRTASDNGDREARDRSQQVALSSAARGYAPLRQQYARPLLMVTAIVILVLVAACANFSNQLSGRSRSRQQEFAVRLVLGAGRWRIVRQSVMECLVLAGVAGALGALIARWATSAALNGFAATAGPLELGAGFDARVAAFVIGCIALVVLFGLGPGINAARVTAAQQLAQAAMRERRRHLAGRVFLVAQLALCVVLLMGAGLMARTIANLRWQGLGFDRNVILMTVAPEQAGYAGEATSMLLRRIRERLLAIRGVVDVSMTSSPLLDGRAYWVDSSDRLVVDGRTPAAGVRWTFADVGPGFFATIGMPLVRGRGFDNRDFVPPVQAVVINQSLARALFGEGDAVGRHVAMAPSAPALRVVGVVNDARQTSPRDRGLGVMYRPLRAPSAQVVLVVRTSGEATDLVDVLHHQLNGLDPDLPVISIDTVEELLERSIAQERLLATLALWLGLLVIVVACIGLHALIANDVAERTHEIGVRLALGATHASVMLLVLRGCAGLVAGALCAGIPLSLAASRPLSSQLYGIDPNDPQTIAAVVFVLVAVGAAAAIRPARAAAGVDPVMLLHDATRS